MEGGRWGKIELKKVNGGRRAQDREIREER